MNEEQAKEINNTENSQYTINKARVRAGLKPLTDPAADMELFVQSD